MANCFDEALKRMEYSKKRVAFHNFSFLYNVLIAEYAEKDDMNKAIISTVQMLDGGMMPLPSGRWGNALAVALEMMLYEPALLIIENADDLGIDLDAVSWEYDGENIWGAEETFEFSKTLLDMVKIQEHFECYKNDPTFKQFVEKQHKNVDAALKITELLEARKQVLK